MKTTTNKMILEFNCDAIDEDFFIVGINIDDSKNYELKNKMIKKMNDSYHVTSYFYDYYTSPYFLFKKEDVDIDEAISIKEEGVTIEKVDAEDLLCLPYNYGNRILGNLMLNSLQANDKYSNSLGKLYYVYRHNNNSVNALVFSIGFNCLLNAEVTTFTKYNPKYHDNRKKTYQKFIVSNKTGSLMYYDKNLHDDETIYVKQGYKGKNTNLPFANYNSINRFEKTKMGYTNDVIKELEKYSRYMTFEFEQDQYLNTDKKILELDLESRYQHKLINIVDKVNNESSKNLLDSIKEYLSDNGYTFQISNEIDKSIYNLVIILDKDSYQDDEDEHIVTDEYVIQHVTVREVDKNFQYLINRCLIEMFIKEDIVNKKISIFDYSKMDIQELIYSQHYSIKTGKTKVDYIAELQIDHEGNFMISESKFEDSRFYEDYKTKNGKVNSSIECVMIINGKHIKISKEGKFVLPDNTYANIIKDYNENDYLDKEDIINNLKEFSTQEEVDDIAVGETIKKLEDYPSKIQVKDLKKVINYSSSTGQNFNKYYYQKNNKLLYNNIRNSKIHGDILSPLSKFRYFHKQNAYKDYYEYYNASEASLELSFHKSFVIRRVDGASNEDFNKLVEMMYVDFIKSKSQTTVLPFIHKYLDEYIDHRKRKTESDNL